MSCTHCQAPLVNGAKFCSNCGGSHHTPSPVNTNQTVVDYVDFKEAKYTFRYGLWQPRLKREITISNSSVTVGQSETWLGLFPRGNMMREQSIAFRNLEGVEISALSFSVSESLPTGAKFFPFRMIIPFILTLFIAMSLPFSSLLSLNRQISSLQTELTALQRSSMGEGARSRVLAIGREIRDLERTRERFWFIIPGFVALQIIGFWFFLLLCSFFFQRMLIIKGSNSTLFFAAFFGEREELVAVYNKLQEAIAYRENKTENVILESSASSTNAIVNAINNLDRSR